MFRSPGIGRAGKGACSEARGWRRGRAPCPPEQDAAGTLCAVAHAPATKLCPPYGSTWPGHALVCGRAAPQVGLDHQARSVPELGAVDLHVLDHALDVVARFREGDALDPIDRIDIGIARIAVSLDPLLHPAASRIVGD